MFAFVWILVDVTCALKAGKMERIMYMSVVQLKHDADGKGYCRLYSPHAEQRIY